MLYIESLVFHTRLIIKLGLLLLVPTRKHYIVAKPLMLMNQPYNATLHACRTLLGHDRLFIAALERLLSQKRVTKLIHTLRYLSAELLC